MDGLFDIQIKSILDLCSYSQIYSMNTESQWSYTKREPFLMDKECVLELGKFPLKSTNMTLITEDFNLINDGEIWINGPDIPEMTGNHSPYGKIVLLQSDVLSFEDPYPKLKDLEHIRSKIHFTDVMQRASSERNREHIRISRRAMDNGVSLYKLGTSALQMYKENEYVKAAQIIYLTGENSPYDELNEIAIEADRISQALNTVLDGLDLDCGNCDLSAICDEVEGLRDLHRRQENIY